MIALECAIARRDYTRRPTRPNCTRRRLTRGITTNGFWADGYAIVDDLLTDADIALVAASVDYSANRGSMVERAGGCVESAADEYGPLAGEMLLRRCRPIFEEVLGKSLVETFAYWRLYRSGGVLKKHKDRPACEISATVSIQCLPMDQSWPIEIEDLHGRHRSIELRPGSALLYQGHRVSHWRLPFTGASQVQLLFHYVIRDGDYAEHALDGHGEEPVTRLTLD